MPVSFSNSTSDPNDEVKRLLERNLETSEEILRIVKSVRKYVFWQQILSWFKIIVILVPLIVGAIYLPPLLKGVFQQYKDILGMGQSVESLEGVDPTVLKASGLSPELLKMLK